MNDFKWCLTGRCYRLGHDVPHAGAVIPVRFVAGRNVNPEELIPYLFHEIDPGFHEGAQAGDIIVTGRNFGMGPKMNGYIAMQALGLGLVCESMPFLAYRAAVGCGLRVLTDCADVTKYVETGDELEVDFSTGDFINHSRGLRRQFSPLPETLREIVALGGNAGWLKHWWETRRKEAS
jgi:3-isopropylmalate/(R)-2-methylmalate dehydratase small subunit